MKENEYHTLEDLLAAKSFRKWAFNEPGDHVTFWENWLTENPDKQDIVEKARLILTGSPFTFKDRPTDPKMIQAEWEKLKKKTFGKDVRPISTPEPADRRPRRIRFWGLRIAASIALLAVLGFLLQQYALNPLVVHQTTYGRQLSIVLPDSTTVDLNANSRLAYRRQNPRKVWLDGEAFFHVKEKPATGANFLVLTNDLTVEVLGTAFNVIEKEYRTEVILEEGLVKLKLKKALEPELYLEPGEMVAFSAQTSEKVEKRLVEPQPLTSWKDGVLEFDDVPLTQVMERIEEIYGWRPVYHDKELQTRNINFPLPSNDLENALTLLGKTLDIKIEKVAEDKVLLLY